MDDFAINLVEVELLRRKREAAHCELMRLSARSAKAEEIFPAAYNMYIDALFMGYPNLRKKWRMETQGEKIQQATDLYREVFGEDPHQM